MTPRSDKAFDEARLIDDDHDALLHMLGAARKLECELGDARVVARPGRLGPWSRDDLIELREALTTCHVSALLAGDPLTERQAKNARQFIYKTCIEAHQLLNEILEPESPSEVLIPFPPGVESTATVVSQGQRPPLEIEGDAPGVARPIEFVVHEVSGGLYGVTFDGIGAAYLWSFDSEQRAKNLAQALNALVSPFTRDTPSPVAQPMNGESNAPPVVGTNRS